MMMNAMTNQHPTDDDVRKAAEELVARYGIEIAIEDAKRRAIAFAKEGRWRENATALRMLTKVEQLGRDAR